MVKIKKAHERLISLSFLLLLAHHLPL